MSLFTNNIMTLAYSSSEVNYYICAGWDNFSYHVIDFYWKLISMRSSFVEGFWHIEFIYLRHYLSLTIWYLRYTGNACFWKRYIALTPIQLRPLSNSFILLKSTFTIILKLKPKTVKNDYNLKSNYVQKYIGICIIYLHKTWYFKQCNLRS